MAPVDDTETGHARRWWTLSVLCLSLVIVQVGNSSLNIAIPTLSRDLHATNSELEWVVAVYALVFAGLLLSTGAIGDRFGRKGALQLGLVGFLVGCLLGTLSHTMWQLIASRALMGVAAAFIMPSTLSILVNVFAAHERPKAIAIWAATAGAAGVIGPTGGGWLLGHFWYGSIFLINVPIIGLALLGGWYLVPKSKDPERAKLDPLGAVLSIVGISAFVYGLIEAPSHGWGSTTALTAFGVSAVVLTLFVRWELRVTEPMLDMRFFRNPAFSIGVGGMILVFLATLGTYFLAIQYFQLILGYSAFSAALRFVPAAGIMVVVSTQTPRLTRRFGAARVVSTGMLLVASGLITWRAVGVHTPFLVALAPLLVLVAGSALCMSPMTTSIMSAVPARRAGVGSAMNDATRELGTALGIAVLGSLAVSQFSSTLAPTIAKLPAGVRDLAGSSLGGALAVASKLPAGTGRAFASSADRAFVDGLHFSVTIGAALVGIAAVLVRRYLPSRLPAEGPLHGALESVENLELGLGGAPGSSDEIEPAELPVRSG